MHQRRHSEVMPALIEEMGLGEKGLLSSQVDIGKKGLYNGLQTGFEIGFKLRLAGTRA